MRKLSFLLLLLCARVSVGQYLYAPLSGNNVGVQAFTGTDQFTQGAQLGPVLFSQLDGLAAPDFTIIGVSDGVVGSSPCAGGGTGAIAQKLSGIWVCGSGNTIIYTTAGLQAAITGACSGTIPGELTIPPNPTGDVIPITASIVVPSICKVQGPGAALLTLQASATLLTPVMLVSGATNVSLSGFGIDGNRALNTNNTVGLTISSSTFVSLRDVAVGNEWGTGIIINGTGSNISIDHSHLFNNGPSLPSQGGAIGIGGSAAGTIRHLSFTNNTINGNNKGISILNPANAANTIEDFEISGNKVYSNANDGISVFSNTCAGGTVTGLRIENNESFSNGWPASGVGFSTNTPPGLLQTGSVASSSGVGIDLISGCGLLTQATVVGNRVHDNVFDGISIDGHVGATVNSTSVGNAVTGPAGSFNVNWVAGQWVQIGGSSFQIATVSSSSAMTLATNPGIHTGLSFTGPSRTNITLTGNVSAHNNAVGFFNFWADGNVYSNNIATLNGLEGFFTEGYQVSYTGDQAFGNDISSSPGRSAGFTANTALNASYVGISTQDFQAGAGAQTTGLLITASANNTYVRSSNIFGTSIGIADSGTRTDSGTFSGTCQMSTGTTCTTTIPTPYAAPICIATVQSGTPIAGSCTISSTTVTVTAASSNSATWGVMIVRNPN